VRRLAGELEALQMDGSTMSRDGSSLAGCWKLRYSEASGGGRDVEAKLHGLQSVERITYVSDHFRLSHSGDALQVFQRV
ncbi:unnamed protein product, partial [Choristocarpus tenellus]